VPLPATAHGLYRLQVTVTTSGGQIATVPSAGTLRIDALPIPDLQVTSLTAPATVHAGQDIAVDFTVAHLGGGRTGPTWSDTVYLALENDTSHAGPAMVSLLNQSALEPGESYQVHTAAFPVPRDFGGTAYVIVKAGDGATFSQALNVIPITPADLVVSDVEAPDQAFT